jgi:2-polyprenyl-3-methyl-5-hydroxy-6-metoxy-1,4-benzoquinol methylase
MASYAAIADRPSDELIRAEAQSDCVFCGAPGVALYDDLTDRFYGASGRWNVFRCTTARCGMLWLNPRPLESDIWKAYRKYYTHQDVAGAKSAAPSRGVIREVRQSIKRAYIASRLGYADRKISVRERMLAAFAYLDPTRRADTDFPLKYLPFGNRGRLLDLGCGSGDLLGTIRSLGWEAEGVDIDPAAVEAARRNGFKVRCGSLHEQRFSDASFDAVVMSHVIEHVHHPLDLLAEVRRILKRGCRLVIATPNARSLGHRMLGARWPFLDPPRHLQVFRPRALESLVVAAGFNDVRACTEIRTAAAMLPRIDGNRIVGRLAEYGENFALHFDRDAGEEIALVAIR